MKKTKFMLALALVLCLLSGQVVLAEDVAGTTDASGTTDAAVTVEAAGDPNATGPTGPAPTPGEAKEPVKETTNTGDEQNGRYLAIDEKSIEVSTRFVHQDEEIKIAFALKDGSPVFDAECQIALKLDNGTQGGVLSYFQIHYDTSMKKYIGYRSMGIPVGKMEEGGVSVSTISLGSTDGDKYVITNGESKYIDDNSSVQDLSGFNFHYINSTYPFCDVFSDDWYQGAVDFANYYEIMTGMTETKFSPVTDLSRAQFATIIYRMAGSPEITYSPKFKDVSDKQFYTKAVLWANSVRIIEGYGQGRFGPADIITREQMATMMYRYGKYKGYDVSGQSDLSSFPDYKNVSEFSRQAVSWTTAAGIIKGDNGKINPQGNASRAVSATIIMRFMDMYE
ncbi:MAG: S-layer homology domain-containing protein [Muricomes sp.]